MGLVAFLAGVTRSAPAPRPASSPAAADGRRARSRNPCPRARAPGRRSSRCFTAGSARKSSSAVSSRIRSPVPARRAGRFPTESRSSTPSTASSGATIPAKRISASTPRPTSASRSPTWCASPSSSSTSPRRISPSRCSSRPGATAWSSRCSSFPTSIRSACCCRATSRRAFAWRPCAATSSPTCPHELRTPLTVLVGFLETVRELKLDPERSRDYLNLMAEQSKRMQRIIDDLLTLSTLESASEPPRDERVGRRAAAVPDPERGDRALGGTPARSRSTPSRGSTCWDRNPRSRARSATSRATPCAIPRRGRVHLIWQQLPEERGVHRRGHRCRHRCRAHSPSDRALLPRGSRPLAKTGGTGLGLAPSSSTPSRGTRRPSRSSTPGAGSRFTAKFPARRVVPPAHALANDALH